MRNQLQPHSLNQPGERITQAPKRGFRVAEGRSTTVTIKYGPDSGDPQVAFQGTPGDIRGDVASFFGFDSDTCAALTLGELVLEVAQLAQGASHVARGLGARVVPQQPAAVPPEAQPVDNPLLGQIEACNSVEQLKELWAANQSAFADPAVMDAWKARGRALGPR
ncbi:hypothetical protein Q3V23_23165 [Streptomyces sp. VNUA116]|uniref:hypothetical protein n=1 Tax=Streptomyces sp. VNUA116 TaxID=3062449 RepID=UPI002676FD5F|nr:hypothetical protein [Streptomyces sp. VNUA116]WKU46725.1 hypothetical protein Q3V23_23165 [Streptomyces sp. VNUA116]